MDEIIPNSNPSSPVSDFVANISLDPDEIPEPDNEFEVNTLQSDSESDLSSYEFNYDSDETNVIDENNELYPTIPLVNYANDIEVEEDSNNWLKLAEDDIWHIPPIPLLIPGGKLNMISPGRQPEDFFNALFDNSMWSNIVDETNRYASSKKLQFGPCAVTAIDNPLYKRFQRLNSWKDVTEAELKVFVGHLLLMGILRKSEIEKYWKTSGVGVTPFFGKFLSRNRFTSILSNLHICDDRQNPPFGSPGHDPLAKIRSFASMCEENFKFTYTPKRDLSLDESCCPWKGRLRFKVYNPRKPARFHIKLFQICEATSGYIVGFSVYTGKDSCIDEGVCLFDECSTTTKVVMTLSNRCNLLDKGYRLFFDNYYTSPELLEELLHRDTLSVGTVRTNRRGFPQALRQAKLKTGESCFRRSKDINGQPGSMLALKWFDKRDVNLLSTSHAATEEWTGKLDRRDRTPIYKPSCIVDYIQKMGGVDLSDQLMNYYSFLRKTCKWWRKLWLHMLNMLILNAYILNNKFGQKKLTHSDYCEYIAGYLVQGNGDSIDCLPIDNFLVCDRLFGRHWPIKIPKNLKGIVVPLNCKVCFVGDREHKASGRPKNRKSTSYKCEQCNLAMCIDPCFRIYHCHKDYQNFLQS